TFEASSCQIAAAQATLFHLGSSCPDLDWWPRNTSTFGCAAAKLRMRCALTPFSPPSPVHGIGDGAADGRSSAAGAETPGRLASRPAPQKVAGRSILPST